MTIVKTHTGTVITKDGPKVKNYTRQSGCGSSAKTSFTTNKPGAVILLRTTRRWLLLETIEAIGGSHD